MAAVLAIICLLAGVVWAAADPVRATGPAAVAPVPAAPARIAEPAAPTTPSAATPPTLAKAPAHPTAPKADGAQPAQQPVTVVTLHRGDTLFALARSHHTTVSALQRLNALGTSTLIYAGHRLRVPAATASGPDASSADSRVQGLPSPTGASTGPVASTQQRGAAAAMAYAEAQLGKPYQWGATGPSAFDCSGLIMRAWQAGGIALPRVTYDQANAGTRVHRAALVPGDLVFTNGFGHVALYLGGATVIQAPHTGAEISTAPLPPDWAVNAYVHLGP